MLVFLRNVLNHTLLKSILRSIKLNAFNRIWRIRNKHNLTYASQVFFLSNVKVNNHTYGILNVYNDKTASKLKIGAFCSISNNVMFLAGVDHVLSYVSTYPFKARIITPDKAEATSKGDIIVQDDVWIGYGSTILSGLTIHQGAVIAAGAVVTKDVPPYAIAAGVPARVIKYRFSQDVINFLLTLDYSQLTEEMIKNHIDDLYKPLDGLSVNEVEQLFSWFPKKSKITTNYSEKIEK